MYCKNCGKQIDDNAVICVHCGKVTENYRPPNAGGTAAAYRNEFYAPFSGLILSFIFPLIGLIVSVSQYKRAKAVYGETKYALAGIVAGAVIWGLSILMNLIMLYKYNWAGLDWLPVLF